MSQSLSDLKVIDCATLFAGPVIASILGDFGAEVIKVEHPRGDTLRGLGWEKDEVSLWWSVVSRNKKCISLNLSAPEGGNILKDLIADADILIENFRPGTMERWGLGPEDLHELNRGLVIVRTTAYGNDGPYSHLPGFGTLAEAMSGFAHINGWPDGPPTLPPFALGDGVAAITGANAAMVALWNREKTGCGQVVDLSITESLLALLGPQATVYDQLGVVQERTGNAAPFTAPRNAYETKDGVWLALSASAQSIAERVARIIGREDWLTEPWFSSHAGRLEHIDELDSEISSWIGRHTADEVKKAFEAEEGAIAQIYTIADIFEDPQYKARKAIVKVPHDKLGMIAMPNVVPRLSDTPGVIQHAGPSEIGADNYEVLNAIGYSPQTVDQLKEAGVGRPRG